MKPNYYVVEAATGVIFPANIRTATSADFLKTVTDGWQTSWLSGHIQRAELEKYALELTESKELVGLGAYRNMPEGVLVYVEYIESGPDSNPNLSPGRRYFGIGAALLAYGIQLSLDYGYGGAIYLKAKTTEIWKHYVKDFGAVPFSRRDPFLLLIDGEAAQRLFSQYLKED